MIRFCRTLVVDKNLDRLLHLSDCYSLMEKGRIVSIEGTEILFFDRSLRARCLGIRSGASGFPFSALYRSGDLLRD